MEKCAAFFAMLHDEAVRDDSRGLTALHTLLEMSLMEAVSEAPCPAVRLALAVHTSVTGSDAACSLPLLSAVANMQTRDTVVAEAATLKDAAVAVASGAPTLVPHPPPKPQAPAAAAVAPKRLSSPYVYERRTNGAGLQTVFAFTQELASSRGFAQSALPAADPRAAFFGLRALHGAVLLVKREVPAESGPALDRFGQVPPLPWRVSTTKHLLVHGTNALSGAAVATAAGAGDTSPRTAAASGLPPLRGGTQRQNLRGSGGAPPLASPRGTVRPTELAAAEAVAATEVPGVPKHRQRTADRIHRRLETLRGELSVLAQRRAARADAMVLGSASATAAGTPSYKAVNPLLSRKSPRVLAKQLTESTSAGAAEVAPATAQSARELPPPSRDGGRESSFRAEATAVSLRAKSPPAIHVPKPPHRTAGTGDTGLSRVLVSRRL